MTLAERQAALVRALVAGGEPPPGFDPAALEATSRALLRKRAGEIARADPRLPAACGPEFGRIFAAWAAGRPKTTTASDAAAFARHVVELGLGGGLLSPALDPPRRARWFRRRRPPAAT